MNFILFMLFSIFEGIGVVYLMLSIFRLRMSEFLWPSMYVIFIQALQSYFLRGEFSLSYLVPVVNVLLFVFLFAAVIRIPILWSLFIAIVGYVSYALIQSLIVFCSFGLFTIEKIQNNPTTAYSIMFISGLSAFLIGRILFRYGLGFSFDFDKLKLKWERALLIVIIMTSVVSFGVILYRKEVTIDVLFLIITAIFFIYYSIRKETS